MSRGVDNSFHTTRWTCVLAARGDSEVAKAALSDLCEAYYEPVYAFIRATERTDSARDLTHSFFASLLKKNGLEKLERDRGKFRSYLLGAVKHFLGDERRKADAEKRGGGKTAVSLDDSENWGFGTATEVGKSKSIAPPVDSFFDKQWALTLLGRALDQVATKSKNIEQFNVLKPWLTGDNPEISQSEAAAKLNLSEGAVKVAIHRLRKQVRSCIRLEIAETLGTDSEAEVSSELDYLIRALS